MEEKNISIKKNMLYNSIGSAIYLGLQWLITILVVRLSGYEDAGILSLAMTISNVIYSISSFGMRGYQSSDIEGKFENYTYILSRVITCVAGLAIGIVFLCFSSYNIYTAAAIFAYIVFKTSEALVDVFHGSEQKKWRMDVIGISYALRGIISFVVFVVTMLITKNVLIAIILMAISVYLEIIVYDIPHYKKIVKTERVCNYKKIGELLLICMPLTIYGFLFNGVQAYPKYMLEKLYSSEVLGIYSSIATPVLIIQVASTFIFNPLITLFAELYANKDSEKFYKLILKIILAILGIGIVGIIESNLFGKFALKILYGEKILQYSYLLNWIIITVILTTIIAFMNLLLTVVRNFKTLIIGNAFTLIVSVILSNIFIPRYGIDGINVALILTLILGAIYLMLFGYIESKKYFKNDSERTSK